MPKYKPLYSLYKGLKESKYDVPDSYVSFQKTLTQAGDAGAKSRRGLYQSLKESNYDVPDTYEGFYKNLFVPVNSTTSRALKIGENPNTPAVNRYHQKLFDSVDPNKNGLNALSHRAVSQAKRAMNNVRKPVTAKVVDKKGKPTGEEFAITPAKTVEDLDREYAQETTKNWENELHDQMADADKDAAKISDMFKSFIGSMDEVGSVWGNMTRGGGIAGTPHSVTTNNGLMKNTEARQLLIAGDYNRKRRELLQLEQDSRNGAFFDNHSFFRGMYDAAKDTGFLTGGAFNLISGFTMLKTKQDLDNGVHTKAGDMLMQQAVKNSNAQSQYGDNQGWMYTGGVITTNMAPFMVQIASAGFSKGLSTSIGKVVQGAASKVALGTMKKAAGFASADLAKNIGKVTGLTTKAFGKAIQYGIVGAAQANTVGLGNVANDVINRYTGQVYQDEQGNYKFGTFDSDGNLVHEGGEDFLTALVKGEAAQTIEFATELAGGGIDAAGTALKNFVTKGGKKIINKYNMENVSKVIDFLLNNKVAKNARYLKAGADRTLGKVEVNSIVGESLEEELGIIANTVFTGDNKISDLWDEKQQSQIWGGMLLSIGLMKGAVAPFHAYNAKQYYSYKHKLNKADVNLSQLLGKEKWEELRNQIDATTNEDMPEMVNKINRDVALGKNRQPVREYIQNLLIMRGYDIGNMLAAKKAVEDKGEGVSVKNMEKNQAYQQGRDAYGYDTHEIQLDQEDKQKSLAQLLGISEQQLASMSDEELEELSGRDDNIDRAIYDYQLSTARYEGVVDNARDQIDLEVQRAAQAVDMYTDKSRNTIRNATIKATGGLEDYGVYIINGNIATHDDGSIDISNSDDMILYYDPTTNTVEHADAMMFAELGSEENADEVRSQAMADAKEKAIKETTGIIDGVVEVGTQFKTVDADGTEHTYEVLADNGDGTAMITIDGNIPTELVKGENVQVPVSFEELQKMKDESDQQRLQAAKAQREQVEKERAEQQMQAQTTQAENPTQEDNIQSTPIEDNIDYSDIIREDGKVQMVDVSDKDGNNLFPDAKDVFYIQGNKMRTKFVYIDANGELKTQSFPTGLIKIKTRGEVSVDDYKKYRNTLLSAESSAIPESSMIEDNSGENRGEIEVKAPTIDGETAGSAEETAAPESAETPATEQAPAITLEDGTIVPMLEDGNPDFSKLSAAQTAELYDSQFGEDADGIVSGYVSDAKKALDKANNMTVKGKTFVEQKAAKDAKEKAIADAQAAYDSAIAIRDAYNERQLAKEENTPEGRKSLIEKARRKYARLKNSEEWSERPGDLWNETVGKLLHRLYDATGIDVFDDTPNTVYEYVAENVGPYSLNYEGNDNSKGVQQETGLSRSDFAKLGWLAAEGKGMTIDAKVHRLWENRPSNLESVDTQEIRNALISLITSGQTAFQARDYIMNQRIELAESALEEQLRQEEDAAEAQKAKEEEEKKKAELGKKKSEEEKTNENRNAPELSHEQQKAMEEGEKLGFPAVDKEGEPINQNVIELANWAKEQGLEIDPTSKLNSYADLYVMCKDGFGVSTLVPDVSENINQVFYFPDNVQGEQLLKLQEEFNVGRDLKHSADMNSELTEGAMFYDGDTAREFRDFVNEKVKEESKTIEVPEDATDEKPLGEQLSEDKVPFKIEGEKSGVTYDINDKEDRKRLVAENSVDDKDILDIDMPKHVHKAIKELCKKMGLKVQFLYMGARLNGWIENGTMYLALDANKATKFVFGHEMTHAIKQKNPEAYKELVKVAMAVTTKKKFEEDLAKVYRIYHNASGYNNIDDFVEEVIADNIGKFINDYDLAQRFVLRLNHPVLATILHAIQKIKSLLYGDFYKSVDALERIVEKAYVDTAKGQVTNSETGEDVSFSLRKNPEPKKKGVGYKVFVLKDGKLYSPMVANPDGAATPVGVWLDADAAPIAGESKTGRPQVKQGGKGTQGGSGKLAYRPGWHLGVVPYAIQFNRKDAEGNKTLFPKNFVFAEVEYAADVDYQEEARQEGINPSGKYQHSLAGLKHLPTDGYYMYRTNPNPETDPWVITGAMKVNRILTRAEQAELVKNAGREPQQIQEGDIITDDVVNSINQEIAAAPKFSLKVYHGSGADFTEFDFDHMGEGAGSQAFGWGGYVTSSKKIGKSYATMMDNDPSKAYYRIQRSNGKRFAKKYPTLESFLHGDKQIAMNDKFTEQEKIDFYNEMKKLAEPYHNLYEVDIPDDNVGNYLDWDAPITDELIDKVAKALPSLRSYDIKDLKKDRTFDNFYKTISMRSVTDDATFNDDKAASKLLSSLGYTGIKYKAGRNFGGAEEGDTNYVIFKPEDMKITQHTKFSLRLKSAIEETETNPSDAQKESGNYKKGHIKFGGYDYTIENPKGSIRSGKDANGKEWKVTMHDTYGYIRGKFGKDGDHLDMFINDKADLDNWNGDVFVVDQVNPDGSFDEHKVMYGYDSMDDAEKAYLANYSKGWKGLGNITGASKDEFDKWLDTSNRKLKPFADYANVKFSQAQSVSEPRYSLKDKKTLAGVHNITEEKLLKAIKQGGLANPSVAVIDSSKQNHEDYGDISLILPSEKVAKRTGKNAGTWQGDAWTPTYPQVERQMSNKGAAKASKDVSSVPGDMYREVRRGLDRWLDGGEANSAMAYMFLSEKGVAPEPKKIQHKFGDDVYNELKSITTGDFNIYGIGKADAQKVLDMYIDAKFDGDKDLYEEKTKAWLERNNSIVDAGDKGGMRYTIAKDNVELYDEYGFNYKSVQTFVRDVEYDHRKTGVDMNATLNDVEDYIKTNNLTDEFNTWLEGKEKEYGIKEVIFDGFTPSGNRRYVPNTLENVSKIMKKQGRNGATGISVSFQNFAASLMPSYGTLKDIRSKKGLLTSDYEDLDKFNEKWSKVFFELGMKCQPDATGTFDDYGLARLSEAAKTSDPQAYLKKEYNVDFSDEDTKRLKEMVKAIKEESPAMYFETKFERPVGFNEFSSAVVPTTASDEVKQALQNAGVQIYEYDKEKEGDRSRAFNEAINSSDNIRFSLKQTNDKFNSDLKSYVENGVLPENSRFELGFPSDILLSAGFPKLPISMRVSLLNKKAGMERHPFSPTDLYNLVDAIQEPLAIFEYTKPNMRNLIVDLTKGEKHFLVGVTLDYRKGDLAVNSISGLFPKENHEWIKWIQDGKAIRIDKKDKVLSLINSLQTNPEEAERIGLNLDFAAKIIKYFENPSVSSENTLSDTKFSLRGSTTYDKQMEEWMEKNHLEKGAVPMEKPIMKEGENIFDYANRMVEWTRNQNLWKTAPKQTGFQDALDKWKADNGLSPDAYPPVRPHRENYSTEIGYTEDLEEYNKKKEIWKSAPKPKDFDLSVDLEDMNKQLRNIRRAVLNQKNYDQRTVKAVSDLVRKMLNIGWGDGLSRGKVGNLLSAAKNATGANDVKKYLDKAMGILAENYLNRLSTAYDNLINTKGARADQSGVIKMGSLDAKGQAFMSEYKKAMNMDDSSLNTYIANIEEDSAKNEDNVEMNDYRLAGIQAAIMYKQQIGGNDADIAELKRQIGELKNKKDATEEDKDLLKSLEKKLFENKFDRITMYENLLNNIQRMVKESKGRAKEFRDKITEHKNEILHRANLDLEGVDSTYYDTTTAKKKFVNNDLQRAVFSSTYTFEQFLKFFGKHSANGEGRLYNYFHKLNQDALDEEQLYNEMNRNALDEKTKELFGKEKFMKLVGIDSKGMKEMDIEVTDYSNKKTGKRTIHLKQGQMLYIYLVNKETDGEMKLRAMGITEEDVAAIEENLDPRVKAMGVWLQDEYLPECQRRYQATHTKYFGAPMKEVENYFPLAINNRARNVKEDVNQDSDAMSQLAGTSTGAIVTRRVNVIPLDIENADAFEVAFNHLQEMEEWSAMLPFRQDINTLLSYTHFRNQVQNMSSVAYGSGKTLWDEFKQTAQIAAGTYKPKVNAGMMDSRIAAAMGGIAVAKISGRLWTAIKQSQSATVFLPECDFTRFVKNGVNPYGSWKWAMETIPDFRKRVENMTYGDVKLRQYLDELEKWHDWTKTISKIGMAPNILVDGITCAVGARSVYETEVNRLTKLGYPKDKADEKAYYKAVAAYNKTQQSSGGMYLSPMQVDRTYVSAALSLFKNANYAYGRMQIEACRGLARTYDFWGGKHKTTLIESMTRQIMGEDGLNENTARTIAKATYNRTFRQSIGRLINFATLIPVTWALYKVLPYLLTGDDDDKKKDMIEEAVLKGFVTSLSDNYVIPFVSNILNAGLKVEDGKPTFDPEVFRYQNLYINPATSDLANIYSMVGNQKWYSVVNKLGMLGVQSLIGFNPETVGALYQAFAEADYDNGNTAKEWQIGTLKAISAPEESIRELYMDELGLKSGDIKKIPLAELEKRYAERQINRDNLLSQIGMDSETFNGYVDKYQKSFEKKIKDKMDKWDEYDKKKADEFFDTTSDPKLKDMIEKKRAKDANAAADEQIAKEGLSQEKKGKELNEEAYDAVKVSIDVAEDNAISTYNKVLNKRYAALNDEYNEQTDAMKYIFMSKHPNFKAYKDLKSEYTTYGKKIKKLKEKLVSADGYDAKQTILKQIRAEREKFSKLQSKVR